MHRVILTILLAAACVMPSSSQSKRPLQPSDLVRLERFREPAFSPDGKWFAYTVVRSRDTAANQIRAYMLGADRADIWIVPVAGGQPTNITRGASDKSGYWSLAWSPDAQRLAFLSTKTGLTKLWLWELSTGRLRPLTDQSVNGAALGLPQPVVWLNPRQLICAVMPEGAAIPGMTVTTQSAERAMQEWPKTWTSFGVAQSMFGAGLYLGGAAGGGFNSLYQVGGPRSVQFSPKVQF